MNDITRFYDELSSEYDSMTEFDKRFEKERPHFEKIVRHYHLNKVLDAGCGTGFHSILLTQLGCSVTAVEISKKMLEATSRNAEKYGVKIGTIVSDFKELSKKVPTDFDAVFCMGNSLPHLLSLEEILLALPNFYAVLKSGGKLFIQILNYERILMERKEVQNIREVGGKTYTRFYEYNEPLIEFNIDVKENNTTRKILKVNLFPIRKHLLEDMILKSNFCNVKSYGSISLDNYEANVSNDLFVIAEKVKGLKF